MAVAAFFSQARFNQYEPRVEKAGLLPSCLFIRLQYKARGATNFDGADEGSSNSRFISFDSINSSH